MNTSYSQSNLRHNQILIWLCILSFFSVLNEMVLNVSLPDIANDFNKPPASTNWVNTAFMLTFSIGTAVYGKLSDQLGIKRLLLFGIIINCFGSVIGFVGHSFFSLLIMARFIQGAGAAAFPALVMVVVARYIPKENRGKAFGLIGSIVAMGEGVGPAIGGMIAHYIHWSYLLLIPMITIITVPFLMKLLKKELWGNYIWNSSRVCLYGSLYDERCSPAKYCRNRKCNYFPWNNECHYFRLHWWDTC